MLRGAVLHIMRSKLKTAPILGIFLIGAALVSGCATSREEDYVASILQEAIRESGLEEAPVVVETPENPPAPISVEGPSVVSVAPSGVVSASPGGSVPTVLKSEGPVVVAEKPVARALPEESVVASSVTAVAPMSVTVPLVPPVTATAPGVTEPLMATPVAVAPVSVAETNSVGSVPVVAATPIKPVEPTIQPDTVLWVSVAEDPSLNGRYMVNNSSAIDFGYVGLVFLQDMTAVQAEAAIRNVLIGRYLNTATVTVKIAKASYDLVGVSGNVEMPSEIKIGPGAAITLSEALRRANGLKSGRESNRVKIVRGGLRNPFGPAAEGELLSLVGQDGQMRVPAVYLRNNDLVYVFETQAPSADGVITTGGGGKRIVLLGEVPRRGVIEFGENEPCTLMYLLFKIGGLPRFAKGDRIQIVRRQKDGSEKTFIVDGDALMKSGNPDDDVVLESGDRVVVPARKLTFF
jgi:protein involved in polysaccharide export with SLBB domain